MRFVLYLFLFLIILIVSVFIYFKFVQPPGNYQGYIATDLHIFGYEHPVSPSCPKESDIYKDIQQVLTISKKVCRLELSFADSLPDQISQFNILIELTIYNPQFSEIPPQIFALSSLKKLSIWNLSKNTRQIKQLPIELFHLKNLTFLVFNGIGLEELPKEIGNLTNLEYLYLNDNNLTKIPEQIAKLKKLKEITLLHNKLSGAEKRKLIKLLPNTVIQFEPYISL